MVHLIGTPDADVSQHFLASADGESPIPAADQQALRDNLLEGLIRHVTVTCTCLRQLALHMQMLHLLAIEHKHLISWRAEPRLDYIGHRILCKFSWENA